MNANRLFELVKVLQEDLRVTALVDNMTRLVSQTQQAVNSPNESTQRTADTAVTQLASALQTAPTNRLSPGLREDLGELFIEGTPVPDLVGQGLANQLSEVFGSAAPNIKVLDKLRELQKRVSSLQSAV